MKEILMILAVMALLGGTLYAKGKLTKTNQGLHLGITKTWYENRIIWGDYIDHDEGTAVQNTKVTVWAEDGSWTHSTTTDDDGNFKVEVEADSPFKLKASDGSRWAEFNGTLAGVPFGTTKNDKTEVK